MLVLLGDASQRVRGRAIIADAGLHDAHDVQRLRQVPVVNALGKLGLEKAYKRAERLQSVFRFPVSQCKRAPDPGVPLSVRHRP